VVSTIGGPGQGSSTDDLSQAGERGPVPNPEKGSGSLRFVLSVLVLWLVCRSRSSRGCPGGVGVVGEEASVTDPRLATVRVHVVLVA
jgi:hypothetical protein